MRSEVSAEVKMLTVFFRVVMTARYRWLATFWRNVFYHKDGGDTLFRNVGNHITDYTAYKLEDDTR